MEDGLPDNHEEYGAAFYDFHEECDPHDILHILECLEVAQKDAALYRRTSSPSIPVRELLAFAERIERGSDSVRGFGSLGKMAAGTRSDVAFSLRKIIDAALNPAGEDVK